jgi:hypothetical protein
MVTIKTIPPMLKPLCTRAIPTMMGEMREILELAA